MASAPCWGRAPARAAITEGVTAGRDLTGRNSNDMVVLNLLLRKAKRNGLSAELR